MIKNDNSKIKSMKHIIRPTPEPCIRQQKNNVDDIQRRLKTFHVDYVESASQKWR